MMRHMKTTIRFITAVTAMVVPAAVTQEDICSCSPTEYTFRLDFDGTCGDGANSADDGQLDVEPVCFYTLGSGSDGDAVERVSRSHVEHARGHAGRRGRRRRAQDFDVAPTVLTSVTFLEFDFSVQRIINQNSSYFETTLSDGDVLTFASVSASLDAARPLAKQRDSVPGGIMLVLFGVNAADQIVQNTVAWSFDNINCEAFRTVENGWVVMNDFAPPKAAFCPAGGLTAWEPTTTVAPEVNATTAAAPEVEGPEEEESPFATSSVGVGKDGESAKLTTTTAPELNATTTSKEEDLSFVTSLVGGEDDQGTNSTKASKAEKGSKSTVYGFKAGKGCECKLPPFLSFELVCFGIIFIFRVPK